MSHQRPSVSPPRPAGAHGGPPLIDERVGLLWADVAPACVKCVGSFVSPLGRRGERARLRRGKVAREVSTGNTGRRAVLAL